MNTRKKTPWPWAIVVGLTTAVSINLGMVWIAVEHRSPPVPGHPEQDALDQDQAMARQRAASALGWRVTIGPCVDEGHGCRVALEVRDRDGRAVDGLRGGLVARRYDDPALDREATLREIGDGRYEGVLLTDAVGMYGLDIALLGAQSPWEGSRELWVPKAGSR